MSVSVTFLGGLGEIGRNCAAVEVDGRIMLIDVGLMFPEEEMLGVDLVFPDWSWLVERAKDVDGKLPAVTSAAPPSPACRKRAARVRPFPVAGSLCEVAFFMAWSPWESS